MSIEVELLHQVVKQNTEISGDIKTLMFRMNQKDDLCAKHSTELQRLNDYVLQEKVSGSFEKKEEDKFKESVQPITRLYRDWKGFSAIITLLIAVLTASLFLITKVQGVYHSLQTSTISIKTDIKNSILEELKGEQAVP